MSCSPDTRHLQLLDAQQHDGDVVPSSRLVRRRDQRLAGLAQTRMGQQDLGERAIGDHCREAVAAQQIDVPVARLVGAGVDLNLRLRPQRARDDRALWVLDGLLGRELALADQLVDERVVVGQAQQLPVAQAVGATVADVRDRHLLLPHVHGGERRAHARVLGVCLGESMDAEVGRAGVLGEAALGIRRVLESLLKGLDRQPRGHLSRLRAPHPVGHDEQRRAGQHRVLVRPPLTPGVGPDVLLGYSQHQSPNHASVSLALQVTIILSPPRTRIRCRRCAPGLPGVAVWVSPATPRSGRCRWLSRGPR